MLNDGFFFPDKFNKLGELPKRAKLNYFYKKSLRIATIIIRNFSRIGAVKNYDEAHKRFFSFYLRFGGGGGGCARGLFFKTHGR